MLPEYWTWPVGDKSKWLSIRIQGRGTTGSDSFIPLGTVSIIFSKIVKHVSWKACGADIALMVAFLSELKIRKSERKVSFLVVTSGPPAFPSALRYS